MKEIPSCNIKFGINHSKSIYQVGKGHIPRHWTSPQYIFPFILQYIIGHAGATQEKMGVKITTPSPAQTLHIAAIALGKVIQLYAQANLIAEA